MSTVGHYEKKFERNRRLKRSEPRVLPRAKENYGEGKKPGDAEGVDRMGNRRILQKFTKNPTNSPYC